MDRDDHSSPSDIITYIGVPLAVLGVLPILYNTVVTLAALSKIKRMLRHSQLKALLRGDVVNRVIEVELPRYAVTPLDRFEHRREYWSLSRCPSSIPGGSWTTFNWRTNAIGNKTQRVEYADQLRQPQVEVAFDELVSYLMDLGAVPDPQGWKLLRTTGLWAPVGCALMKSPDGRHKALTVAPLNDSDGNLSLAVNWSSDWITRTHTSLPPFWVKLPAPASRKPDSGEGSSSSSSHEGSEPASTSPSLKDETKKIPGDAADSIQHEADTNARRAIACHISEDGLVTALPADDEGTISSRDSLYIDHLRISPTSAAGVWFASATTALGSSSQTALWNYKIPEDVLAFARKESVPCGVLELIGAVDDTETPEWETGYDKMGNLEERLSRQAARAAERMRLVMAENQMPPEQRAKAVRERMQRESQQQLHDLRDENRKSSRRKEARVVEALGSAKWHATKVSTYTLRWLRSNGHAHDDESLPVREVAGRLLHRMVLDGRYAADVCDMLGRWKVWCDNGGMRRSDFEALEEGGGRVVFAEASLLVSVIREAGLEAQASVVLDLQECLRLWHKVRLG